MYCKGAVDQLLYSLTEARNVPFRLIKGSANECDPTRLCPECREKINAIHEPGNLEITQLLCPACKATFLLQFPTQTIPTYHSENERLLLEQLF